MVDVSLKSTTIGAIREFVDSGTSRDELKGLALKSGANAERVMGIAVLGNMNSSGYKSKSTLMNEIFDTVYQDFDKPEADGVLLRMINFLLGSEQWEVLSEKRQELEDGLAASGLSIDQIIGANSVVTLLETALEESGVSNMVEASELLRKGLHRLSTDKPGAITACTSACESVCRVALERLNMPLPAGKKLPDYLNALSKDTNIKALARIGGQNANNVFSALRSLALHSYQAAHELGDRHAHGDTLSQPSDLVADLLVTSCAALTIVIAGAVSRNEIKYRN